MQAHGSLADTVGDRGGNLDAYSDTNAYGNCHNDAGVIRFVVSSDERISGGIGNITTGF
jgi:hypothetical protein